MRISWINYTLSPYNKSATNGLSFHWRDIFFNNKLRSSDIESSRDFIREMFVVIKRNSWRAHDLWLIFSWKELWNRKWLLNCSSSVTLLLFLITFSSLFSPSFMYCMKNRFSQLFCISEWRLCNSQIWCSTRSSPTVACRWQNVASEIWKFWKEWWMVAQEYFHGK